MYSTILVPLDGSEVAEEALPSVENVGTRFSSQIVLLRVAPPPDVVVSGYRTIAKTHQAIEATTVEFEGYLSRVADRLRSKGLIVHTEVKFGDPAEEIVDYAKDNAVDLIAMCTHGRGGISRWVYGSVADRVLRAAATPVLLIRWSGAKHE